MLHGSALQLWALGEVSRAAALEESAVSMFRSAGENRWLSYSLALLARVRTGQEQLDQARALLEEARSVWSRVETTYGQPFDAYLVTTWAAPRSSRATQTQPAPTSNPASATCRPPGTTWPAGSSSAAWTARRATG